MNVEEIKKALYKEKVIAIWEADGMTFIQYRTKTSLGEHVFQIPLVEAVGEVYKKQPIKASLLIRWLHVK